MMSVEQAQQQIDQVFRRYGINIPEACEDLNTASFALAHAAHTRWGRAWLGSINGPASGDRDRRMWEWNPETEPLRNFGACFIVPRFIPDVDRLIAEHRAAPPATTAEAYAIGLGRLTTIRELVKSHGYELFWA
jgi:hypothetical protein